MARAALEKKAERIRVLDVRDIVGYTDYLVICEAGNARQAGAIADHILETLEAKGIRPLADEGRETGSWILLDYSDVIAHVFMKETREFYDLEGFFADAKTIPGWDKTASSK